MDTYLHADVHADMDTYRYADEHPDEHANVDQYLHADAHCHGHGHHWQQLLQPVGPLRPGDHQGDLGLVRWLPFHHQRYGRVGFRYPRRACYLLLPVQYAGRLYVLLSGPRRRRDVRCDSRRQRPTDQYTYQYTPLHEHAYQ